MTFDTLINTDITRAESGTLEDLIYAGYKMLDESDLDQHDTDDVNDQIDDAGKELDKRVLQVLSISTTTTTEK